MAPHDQNPIPSNFPFHPRRGSDELDVFQATNYFACEEKPSVQIQRMGRMSLNLPTNTTNSSISSSLVHIDHTHMILDKKQPRTPARRIANFLSSLFNQTSNQRENTKNKNSKLPIKERRNSIRESPRNQDLKSTHSSSSSDHSKAGSKSINLSNKIIMPVTSPIIYGKNKVLEYANELSSKEILKSKLNRVQNSDHDDGDSDSSSDLFELKNDYI